MPNYALRVAVLATLTGALIIGVLACTARTQPPVDEFQVAAPEYTWEPEFTPAQLTFLDQLRAGGYPLDGAGQEQQAVILADRVCSDPNTDIVTLQEMGMSRDDAATLVFAAVLTYCPVHVG